MLRVICYQMSVAYQNWSSDCDERLREDAE